MSDDSWKCIVLVLILFLSTGTTNNILNLPANNGNPEEEYELAFAIQDRQFKADGKLYYPAHKESTNVIHPAYDEFIEEGEVNLTDTALFPYPAERGVDENGGVRCKKYSSYFCLS